MGKQSSDAIYDVTLKKYTVSLDSAPNQNKFIMRAANALAKAQSNGLRAELLLVLWVQIQLSVDVVQPRIYGHIFHSLRLPLLLLRHRTEATFHGHVETRSI